MKLVLTCEHANNHIPQEYEFLFKENEKVLETHEGFDPGAFDLFQHLRELSNYSRAQEIGRLLIETNRSIGHKSLFSRFSAVLPKAEKERLIDKYYLKYRNAIENELQQLDASASEILHLSIHSFTPVLNGIERNADIGILFDAAQNSEKEYSRKLKSALKDKLPEMHIRFNYPYLGKADGFTTYLRRKNFSNYSGIEIEINQKWVRDNTMNQKIRTAFYEVVEKLK